MQLGGSLCEIRVAAEAETDSPDPRSSPRSQSFQGQCCAFSDWWSGQKGVQEAQAWWWRRLESIGPVQFVCSFCFLVVCVALRAYLGTVCGSLLNLEPELLQNHEASLFDNTRGNF